jgi:hypothetical protein
MSALGGELDIADRLSNRSLQCLNALVGARSPVILFERVWPQEVRAMNVSRKRRFLVLALHLRPNPNSPRLRVANFFGRLLFDARRIPLDK